MCMWEIWTRELLSVNSKMSSVSMELSGGKNRSDSYYDFWTFDVLLHFSHVHF